ncbi:hypothetical protein Trydic_g19290 [Trypoxylus dichotomus]
MPPECLQGNYIRYFHVELTNIHAPLATRATSTVAGASVKKFSSDTERFAFVQFLLAKGIIPDVVAKKIRATQRGALLSNAGGAVLEFSASPILRDHYYPQQYLVH